MLVWSLSRDEAGTDAIREHAIGEMCAELSNTISSAVGLKALCVCVSPDEALVAVGHSRGRYVSFTRYVYVYMHTSCVCVDVHMRTHKSNARIGTWYVQMLYHIRTQTYTLPQQKAQMMMADGKHRSTLLVWPLSLPQRRAEGKHSRS